MLKFKGQSRIKIRETSFRGSYHELLLGRKDDMNIEIDESDRIVVDPVGGDVGKRGAGLPSFPDSASSAAARVEVGKAAVEEGGGGG
jgi:hypothetical protein